MFNHHIRKLASEKLTALDLLLKGFIVSEPVTDIIENYDLIAEKEGKLYKIQVKSAKEEDNRMLVDIRRSSSAGKRQYEDGAYDVIALVNLERRLVAYIHKQDMTAKSSLNVWCCEAEEVPTQGRHKGYSPVIFFDHMEFPIR